jgi:ribosomal-protein-alanine N-acetyltransferase
MRFFPTVAGRLFVAPGHPLVYPSHMSQQPIIKTERLILRPFRLADAPTVRRLAGVEKVASTTLRIPHPYEKGMAENWIRTHKRSFDRREAVVYAIVSRRTGKLIGAISLQLDMPNESAELGFWIGSRNWNRGYATEAAEVMLMYGFTELGLNRIHAHHFTRNPASGRVLEKIGMRREGVLRQHIKKWGRFADIIVYAILREDYQ